MTQNIVHLSRGLVRCSIATPEPLPAEAYGVVAELTTDVARHAAALAALLRLDESE